jgi:hypothetical protein
MDIDKPSSRPQLSKLSQRPTRRPPPAQQQAEQENDSDRQWRECIALNRFGARTEDYTFAGRRH